MRLLNLALKLFLELAAMACFAVWGWQVGSRFVGAVLAVAAPAAGIVVWGLFAAPRARRRLPTRWRIPLELGIFLLAALALAAAGHALLAALLLLAIVVNAIGLTVFRQWEA